MPSDIDPPSGTPLSDLRNFIEIFAALSGVFLLVAYIQGRIFLQAYYSAFHTDVSELGLSIQDIMFQSYWSLLGPALLTLTLAAQTPLTRRSTKFPSPFKRPTSFVAQLLIVLLFVLACAIVFGLIFSLSFSSNGATSARYSSGAVTSAFVGLLSLVWLNDLLSRTTPSHRSGYEYLAALGVTVYLVLVAPYVFGALAGQASRYNDDPGSALPTVVVTADHPLDSSWTANGNDFISPTLRLLGRNSSFLVVWDPRHPDKSYSIPLAGIRTIERGH